MNQTTKKLLVAVVTVVLIIIFTPFFSNLYEMIIGRNITTWFAGSVNPQYFEGFMMSYAFFVTLMVIIFGARNKYKLLAVLVGLLLLFDVFLASWEGLIIDFSTALVAFIFAQIILFTYKKLKK